MAGPSRDREAREVSERLLEAMTGQVVHEGDDTAAGGCLRELIASLGAESRTPSGPIAVQLPVSLDVSYEPDVGWTARARAVPAADWRQEMDERHRQLWANIGRLQQIAAQLNGRPRQTLAWQTPAEKMTELLR